MNIDSFKSIHVYIYNQLEMQFCYIFSPKYIYEYQQKSVLNRLQLKKLKPCNGCNEISQKYRFEKYLNLVQIKYIISAFAWIYLDCTFLNESYLRCMIPITFDCL